MQTGFDSMGSINLEKMYGNEREKGRRARNIQFKTKEGNLGITLTYVINKTFKGK